MVCLWTKQVFLAVSVAVLAVVIQPYLISAQSVQVSCFTEDISGSCTASERVTSSDLPYDVCCTQTNSENNFYRINGTGDCTRCGPVLDEGRTMITISGPTTSELQWDLLPGSIPAVNFRVSSGEEGSFLFGRTLEASTKMSQFIELETGVRYLYRIVAVSANSQSPPLDRIWEAGRSLFPVFVNFTVVSVSHDTAQAEVILVQNGIAALTNVVIRWREALEQDFPVNNTLELTYSTEEQLEDGALIGGLTFENLRASTRYAVSLIGTNDRGDNLETLITFDTDAVTTMVLPTTGALSSAEVVNILSTASLLLTALFTYIMH